MSMTLISTVTVGSGGAATINFTSISSGFTDLFLVYAGRTDRASAVDGVAITFNGSTTGYSERVLYGNGASALSESDTAYPYGYTTGNSATSNTHGSMGFYIPNYAGSTNKSISIDSVGENNATTAFQSITAALWSNTSAITSLALQPKFGSNFLQHSSASLYGILKGSGGATVS